MTENQPTLAAPMHQRKDVADKPVLSSFQAFLEDIRKERQQGKILQIVSSPDEQGLGGLGKTFETWNFLTWFRDEHGLPKELEVIDFSEDSDRFGIILQVVRNLEAQLPCSPFTKFNEINDLSQRPEAVLSNTLSKLAVEALINDLKGKNYLEVKGQIPPMLFFDSLDWVVDEEILKLQKTAPMSPDWQEQLKNANIKDGSFFHWLVGEQGLFRKLVEAGISMVVSGRYDLNIIAEDNPKNAICSYIAGTILLGGFEMGDLKAYLENVLPQQKIPEELTDDRLDSILTISRHKPVMAVAIADFIANQYRKARPETLENKLWSRLKVIETARQEGQSHWGLLFFFLENLYDVTGSLESAEAVKYMNLLFYRLEPRTFAKLMGKPENWESDSFWQAVGSLSLVKRYPNAKTGRKLQYLRPHDDILTEFHKYWSEVDSSFKDFWYSRCLKDFELSATWEAFKSDETLLKNQELYYLTYLFEAAQNDEEVGKAVRYAQFVFSEHIDQNPDHAERILSRAEIYFPFDGAETQTPSKRRFSIWLSLRRVEYWLTERTPNTELLAGKRLDDLLALLNKSGDMDSSQVAVVQGYMGELAIWRNQFHKAEDLLNSAISKVTYTADDTQLLPWLLHLKGFRYNRNADFDNSVLFNGAAIQKALPYLIGRAKHYHENFNPEKTFFEQDQAEAFRFRRIFKVLQRAVGNLAAIRLYAGKISVTLKNSFGQIYLWEPMPTADREKARVYANLLKAVCVMGLYNWSNWSQIVGDKLSISFEKDPLVSRNTG